MYLKKLNTCCWLIVSTVCLLQLPAVHGSDDPSFTEGTGIGGTGYTELEESGIGGTGNRNNDSTEEAPGAFKIELDPRTQPLENKDNKK